MKKETVFFFLVTHQHINYRCSDRFPSTLSHSHATSNTGFPNLWYAQVFQVVRE